MIMCWQGLFRVLLIYSLVQASCSKETASSRREDIGIIVGTPLIALAEAQGDKNEKGQVHLKETGSIINSDKLQYIAPTGAKNNIFQKNNHSYLPFLNSKLMKDMDKPTPYYSFNRSFANVHREQNEARDVNDIVAPSQFTEKVYSELEGREPKAPGFQVEKEGFSDPWDHGMPTENLSNSTSITNSSKSLPLETLEKAKNGYFDEEFANDPLATNMDPMTSKTTPNIRIISTVISASRNVSSSNTLQSAKDTALEEKTMNEPLVTPVDHMASKENKNIGISTVMTASKNVSSLKTLQERIMNESLENQNIGMNTVITASKNVSPLKTLQKSKDAALEEKILKDPLVTPMDHMGSKKNQNMRINTLMTASKNVSPSETWENATEAAFQGTILIEPLAVPVDHMTSKNVQNVGINTFMTPSQNVFPSETVQTDEPEFGEKILNDPLTTSIDHMAFKNAQNIGINTLVTASKNVSPSERVQKAEEADFGEKILNDPLTIPVGHMTSKENKTIGINTVTSSFKNVPPKALQNAKNPTLDENKLKDPLENQNIEVSTDMSSSRNVSPSKTLQNAEEELLPWHDPSAKISKSNFDWNGSFKENKANFLPTESSDQQGYHDLSEVDRNASNDMRYANTGNGGLFALDPSNKGMYFQTIANNNNQSTSSILREENASKESNMELSQLIESVMNHLGNKASNVVATELAKYPMFKDMWATAIAHALVKQSSHLLRNDSSKKAKEVSQLSPPKTSSLLEKQSKQLTVGTKLPKTQVNSGRMVALINGGVKNSHSTLRLSKDRPFAVKIQSESLSSSIKGRLKANEDNLQHNQKMRKEPFYNKAPSKSHPQKTRKKPFLTEGEANLLENHLVAGNKHVISPPMRELISSKKPVNPETNIPFLFDRFTTLDPGESKYVQLNLMNDPIAKEEFSQADSVASYPNQQQQERQDEQEAKFVEHQINRGYQSSGRAQQNLNMAMTRENSGEAKFVAGQVLADPFTKEELAESLTPENKIINEENRQNAQIMAAILNDDDKKVSESYQEGNLPKSNELHFQDEKSYEEQESPLRQGAQTESSSSTEQFENLDKPSDLENVPKTDKLKVKDAAKLAAELESKMLLNSKVVSDISAIDVAPMRRLQALQGSYDVNKARNFMHAPDAENEISDHVTRQMDPYSSTQYGMDRFHGNKRQSHKKNDIQMKRPDDSQTQATRHRTFASTLSSAEKVLKSSLDLTSTNQSINTEVPLKKLRVSRQGKDQSGSKNDEIEQQLTRESDISPTSIIFGLTSKEMKELGRHMLRKPHGAPALSGKTAETDHIQELLPAAKGYYDEYTEMEQPKETLALLVKKLKKRKIKTKASVVSGHRVHKTSNKILHHRNSVPISKKRELKYHQQKKINSQKKRDLGTWEGSWRPSFDTSTQVLNSDLDQLRGLSPRAQEDISKTILRDDNGEARSSNQIGPHYPIYGNDEFQRSITQSNGNYEDRTFGKPKESDGHTYIRRTKLPTQPSQRRRKVVNNDTYKKDEFSLIIDLNTTKPKDSEPLLIKGNKILNGDVSLLDEVKNLDAHDEILKTLRQESEGDLSYVNTLQNHDLNRIKNLFRSAGNEVGTKRFTQIHPPTGVAHLQTNKNLNRRNLIGDAREISDDNKAFSGTADALDAFQNPEVQTQLLHDLHDENINTLSYVDALQDADKHRLKMLHREADQFGTDWTGEESPHQVFRNGEKTRKSDSETETFKNSQKKLREFLKHIRKIKVVKNGKNAKHDKTQRGAVRELKYDVFPKFSPEGNILSTDYKELGSFTGDDQTELASILRSENKGDQKDLNNFEKMDEDDERDVDLLFSTFSGPSKRSTDEKATKKRDDLIETIADVSDPESKEKEISVVVSGEDAQPQFGEEAKKVEEPRPSEWSSWSRCSTSCGEGSIKTRSKYCDENSTSDAIVKCPGWNHQSIPCNVSHHCPVDGGFTQWTDWSECSESCGPKAVHMRMRLCTNPPPSYGGKDCSGWRFQVEYCKSKECPHKQGTSGTTDQHVAKMKAQNKNNRIIFKTLSATPLIEEISSNIPTDAVDRSRERTISRFSDLRHYVQDLDNGQPSQIESDVPELQRIPDIQRVFNVEQLQIPSMQQLPSAPQIQTTSHLHSMQQLESEPQISTSSHLQSVQQLSDTPQIQSQSHLNSVQQLDSEAQMPTVPHLQNVQQLSSSPEIESTSNLHTMHQLDSESQIPTASHLRNMQQLSGTPDIETGSHLHTMHQLDSEPPMPTTSHLQNMQQLSSAPQIDTISHLHSVQQLSRAPQIPTASHLHGMQQPSQRMGSMSSMSFLKPDMTSMSQNEQETFENGMKTIHLRAKSEGIGFTPWNMWSTCTVTCGRGMRTRTRTCIGSFEATGIDNSCLGPRVQTKACRRRRCPIKVLSLDDGNCCLSVLSTLELRGYCYRWKGLPKQRTCQYDLGCWQKSITQKSRTGVECRPCVYAREVYVDGQFTPWSDWSECSKSCGPDSYRKRERTCTDPPPRYGGEECEGRSVQRRHCLKAPCPPNNNTTWNITRVFVQAEPEKNASANFVGGFTEWGPWSQCSKTCGSDSLRVRKRSCYNPFPFGGQNCNGSTTEVKPCLLPPCLDSFDEFLPYSQKLGPAAAVNISVKNEFDWSPWSPCTETCGPNSYRTRERTCSLAFTENNGRVCIGADIQKIPCDVPLCETEPSFAMQQENAFGQNKNLLGTSAFSALPAATVADMFLTPQVGLSASSLSEIVTSPSQQDKAVRSPPAAPARPVPLPVNMVPGTQATPSILVTATDPVSPSAKAAPGTQAASSASVTPADPVSPSAKAAPGTQGATSVPVTAADPVSPSAKAAPGTQGATSVLVTPADPVSPSAKAAPGTQGATSVPVTAADPVSPSAKAAPGTQGATSVSVTAADPVSPPAKAAPGTQAAPSPSVTAAEPVSPPAKAAPGTPAVSSASLTPADPVSQPAKMAPGTQASLSASANQVDSVSPPAKAAFGNQTLPSLSAAPIVPVSPLGKEAPETQSIAFATKSAASPVPSSVAAGSTGSQATTSAKPVPGTQITPIMPSSPSKRLAPLPKLPPPNPNFSDWSPWSKCSATCGPKAVMYRERTCKLRGGRKCQGPNIQTKPCPLVRCPVHGGFSQWSQWTHCPVTCGTMALARRQRTCTNPKPMLGGRECEGERMQIKNCGREICPVNGGLTGWTEWSSCTKTCNTNAVSIRERYCTNPPPRGRGRDCMGQRMQAKACASLQCPVDGGYTAWSEWSECPRCIRGTRKRLRSCTNPPPTNGGKPCVEPAIEEEDCPFVRCKTSLGFGQWSSFGKCSRSCGGGIKRRRRRCRRPWRGCYGPRVQRRRCNRHSCPNENFLVRADPVELCGFNPCKVAKCALDQSAMCVSNSKCKPVFFNTDGKIIESCRGDSILLAAPPEQVCQFNPCKNSACYTSTAERCVVSYKCKPIFYGGDGRPINCRGILTVPAKDVCGFDPCFEKACKVDLTARCVSDAECKPTFISKTERILDECVEDSSDDDSNDEDEETEHTKKFEPEDRNEDSNNEENEGEESDAEADSKKYDENDDDDDEKDEDIKRKRKKHRKDDEDLESDDEEEDDEKPRRHRKKFRNDDDDDDADDNEDDRDNGESKKKDITPFVNLNVTSSRDRMVSGMGSEISFVSKNGPAKFYWLRRGDKGSKNSTQMLVIEAKGSKKSAVLNAKQSNKTGNPR